VIIFPNPTSKKSQAVIFRIFSKIPLIAQSKNQQLQNAFKQLTELVSAHFRTTHLPYYILKVF